MNQIQQPTAVPPKRPSRWSPRNWPVRGKVFAIVAVPLALALAFAGARIWDGVESARDLQVAADRVQMIPVIESYVGALQGVLLAYSSDGDTQSATNTFDKSKATLQNKLNSTDVAPDVRTGVTNLLTGGQQLVAAVSANTMGLRDRITAYAPILLTAEDAINGSVRIDDEKLRVQTQGLSRAIGARGQMLMQELLVEQGGDLPEPELRTSMITLAGTEPSTLFGMSQVLGVGSPEAKTLQSEMVRRMGIMSSPDAALAGNADLRQSLQATDAIAEKVVTSTTDEVTTSVQRLAADRRHAVIRDGLLVLAAFIAALVVVLLVARSLVRPLRILRDGALRVAHTDLEQGIARVRAGDEREPQPLPVYTTEEIGQVAHAVDELHTQALLLAGDEARLRLVINEMFETMSRRNRSLVDQQLSLIDQLERNEKDPERLDNLFRLDHLATRMRRIGSNLLVLAGAQVSRDHRESLPLASAVNGAVSEVEDYKRVQIGEVSDSALIGRVSADAVHMLAELIDNALRYSPPISPVRVTAVHAGNAGVLIEVHDDGIGMTDSDLRIANMRLHAGGEVSPDNTRHMGLFVVGRLAHMHGMEVRLRNAVEGEPSSGTTAELFIPAKLLEHGEPVGTDAQRYDAPSEKPAGQDIHDEPVPTAAEPAAVDPSGLPRRSPGSSGITGAPTPEPEPEPEPEPQRSLWFAGAAQSGAENAHASDTSGFFAARARAEETRDEHLDISDMDVLAAGLSAPDFEDTDTDFIYQKMLNELMVDPHTIAVPQDWKSVWDNGWETAAEVDNVPVQDHTEHGLPVRDPGARLVPGAAESPAPALPQRDPDAVRSSFSSHFGGVRAARSGLQANSAENGNDHT
ncbi:sensor histidine kinase [Mycolicibacterium rhodesiae]|uniref:histidine kinase n=1 Tax=Mycolicibacterium rhodesiae TaxID=36814 RepID=A0A1X0IKF2_MYCRH|nr:sensor histidine kinase [Mycolicibacterium rhodesiae]MCV7348477.1 sensor histidine kinase [Mycolicibacterium rhodesiae]ORB48471.1 ATP-binding protein [Mycolicibacterium rhodesiae]